MPNPEDWGSILTQRRAAWNNQMRKRLKGKDVPGVTKKSRQVQPQGRTHWG